MLRTARGLGLGWLMATLAQAEVRMVLTPMLIWNTDEANDRGFNPCMKRPKRILWYTIALRELPIQRYVRGQRVQVFGIERLDNAILDERLHMRPA
jgi:hypothetical protein